MAGVLHDGVHQRRNQVQIAVIEIDIAEDDLRALAAELQRDGAVPLGRDLLDQGANFRASGKTDVVNARVAGQSIADFVTVAGDDIDCASRKTRFSGQLCDTQQRQTGVLGRLDDADVARGQGTGNAAAKNLHRVVPRNDVTGHAVRLAPGHHAVTILVRKRIAVQLVAGTGIKLEITHQCGGVGARLFQRFAAVAHLDLRQIFGVRRHAHGQSHHQAATLGCAEPAPDRVKTIARGANRDVDVVGIAALDLVEGLAVGRVDDRNGFAR